MATRLPTLEPEFQRTLAAGLFNLVWELLERPDRTAADAETMLHAAHASRYFWGGIGAPKNAARGEWLLARVYAVLGRAEPALHHARCCLSVCEANAIGPFDLAFAHEALARSHNAAGDSAARDRHLALAQRAAKEITDAADAAWLRENLATIA